MTRTEERLADALDAAARAMREETMPPLQASERGRGRLTWAAPAAAAASLLLVVGLGVVVARALPGSGHTGALTAPRSFYLTADLNGDRPVVRSTATGAVTATVPVPSMPNSGRTDAVAATSGGTYFVAAFTHGMQGQRIYRFRLTPSGQVSSFSPVPGGVLGGRQWEASAIAPTADGSRIAVSFSYQGTVPSCGIAGLPKCPPLGEHADYIDVINVANGAKSAWRGGLGRPDSAFNIADLSWTSDGHELTFLGQWCKSVPVGSEACQTQARRTRNAEVWVLDPGPEGGRLNSGRLLLRQSARLPYIAQALISPDGSSVTAVVLSGRETGFVPGQLAIEQISIASGQVQSVLYRQQLGATSDLNLAPNFLGLRSDGTGEHWLLYAGTGSHDGFNGWLDAGQLVKLQPVTGALADEAW